MSWPNIAIGDVALFSRSSVAPEKIESGTTYVGLEHIDSSGNFVGVSEVSAGELGSSKFRFGKEHVLFGKLRPYLRKTARPEFDGICSTDILPLRPTEKVDRDYLFHALRVQSFVDEVSARATGVNLPRVSPAVLAKVKIPLPPLPEQRRIAAILDKADVLRAKRREAIAKLDQLLQSVFLEMFGDPVGNPKNWRVSTIASECEVGSGSTPSRQIEEHFGGEIPWVKSTEVDWGRIGETGEHVSMLGQKVARLKIFPVNTVVVALYGQGTTRGKCALLCIPATMNQACAGIQTGASVNPTYLFQYLKWSYERLRGESRGGNQENLNLGILKAFELPLPPIALQQKFAAFSDAIERRRDHIRRHATALDALFASSQQRAFAGTL